MGSPAGRAAEADVKLQFGMMTAVVNLYTMEDTSGKREAKLRSVCPQCHADKAAVNPLSVQMFCDEGHGPYSNATALKAAEDESGVLQFVASSEDAKAARAAAVGLEKKELMLEFLRADDVLDYFAPADKTWVVQPKTKDAFFSGLLAMMSEDGTIEVAGDTRIGVGTIRMRDTEHLVRLSKWGDQLTLTKLLRPEDCKRFPAPPVTEVTDKNRQMLTTLIGMEDTPFDPDRYSDQARQRVIEWKRAATSGGTAAAPAAPKVKAKSADPNDALEAMLEAALQAAQAKKEAQA